MHIKGGGCLSIATQGSYWLSSPHPLALSTASRPGIPATAETRSRVGTRGCRAERGAKARGERHARTLQSNLAPANARTRRHTRERPLILEISYRPEAPATVAPSPHLMLSLLATPLSFLTKRRLLGRQRGPPEHHDSRALIGPRVAHLLALTTASRPGIPATAEAALGLGPVGTEHQALVRFERED